ncbi:putative quinol monooxygenase [Saccharibacillus sp. JS10]|uniref:putative quinol monooxygenase n=1 Tax=Saccharibacillus sp. JS10 TaxID=2950552 RepID=UPI00210D93DB|nr:antibiotic biosynthesis monooxygenase [Saccharibacillus sp. JS10]MCQ4087818.1 antibiotic biosynthesis monooxygenase [Saccharibacillus sp. JS10]
MSHSQIHLYVRFKAKPGKREAFREELSSLVDIMSAEKTFISSVISDDLDQPDDVVIYEVWQGTKESWLAEELPKPYRQAYEDRLNDLVLDRKITWLEPITEWGTSNLSK